MCCIFANVSVIFIGFINNNIHPEAYTSLKGICGAIGASYSMATKGNLTQYNMNKKIEIVKMPIIKIKGRGSYE